MANPSVNKIVLFLLALFALLAITVIYINLDSGKELPEIEIPLEEFEEETQRGNNAIASIDAQFEPSPVIESFILLNHRGTASQLDMIQPAQDTLFNTEDIKNGIQFSGNFPVANGQINLRIKVYSNDTEAFNEGRAVFVIEMKTLNGQDNTPRFSTSLNLDLSPGLYYYILETIEDDLFLGGGKFRIVP